jgi:RNA polymerase sigma-54 factor
VLTVCHGFEPTGIMARSVPECLKLQLIERNRFDPAMAPCWTIWNCWPSATWAAASGLRRRCRRLAEMIAELKALTPRPGAGFGGERPRRSSPTSTSAPIRPAAGRWS